MDTLDRDMHLAARRCIVMHDAKARAAGRAEGLQEGLQAAHMLHRGALCLAYILGCLTPVFLARCGVPMSF